MRHLPNWSACLAMCPGDFCHFHKAVVGQFDCQQNLLPGSFNRIAPSLLCLVGADGQLMRRQTCWKQESPCKAQMRPAHAQPRPDQTRHGPHQPITHPASRTRPILSKYEPRRFVMIEVCSACQLARGRGRNSDAALTGMVRRRGSRFIPRARFAR